MQVNLKRKSMNFTSTMPLNLAKEKEVEPDYPSTNNIVESADKRPGRRYRALNGSMNGPIKIKRLIPNKSYDMNNQSM